MAATAGRSLRLGHPVIERASPSDRAFLAMGTGRIPEQFGVILMLAGASGMGLERARELIGGRIPAGPRMRPRLVGVPFGCGGLVWVDEPRFDIRRHVRAVACPEPGDEQALLDTALSAIMNPLPPAAPLWAAALVTGPAGDTVAGAGWGWSVPIWPPCIRPRTGMARRSTTRSWWLWLARCAACCWPGRNQPTRSSWSCRCPAARKQD